MSSRVLILGGPSDGWSQGLSGAFQIQNCRNPAEGLALVGSFQALICCESDEGAAIHFVQQACALNPALRVVVFVPGGWSDAILTLGESLPARIPLLLLPAETRPALAAANLRTFLREEGSSSGRTDAVPDLLEQSVNGTVSALYEVLAIVDPYSASLGQRLRYAADLFCKSARLPLSWELETGALLAEVGVLTVPVRVILKSQSGQDLSTFEHEMLAHIHERGADLLHQIPCLDSVAAIIRYQGKNYDGTGLPEGNLSGDRIPPGARILKILNDLFKLKESGKNQEAAISEMENRKGRYDPALLRVARECFAVSLPSKIAANSIPTTIKNLRPGQLVVSNIETDDGVLIIRDGQVVSPRLIHKLCNFALTSGIREPIYVINLLESREMTTSFTNMARSESAYLTREN